MDTPDGDRLEYWAVATFMERGMQRMSQYSGAWSDFACWCRVYAEWVKQDAYAASENEGGSDDEDEAAAEAAADEKWGYTTREGVRFAGEEGW